MAGQTFRPAELILVDDGSPDQTGTTLSLLRERYGTDWIQVIRLPANMGASSARNAGWEVAREKYIAFLDADDAWHPRKIEIQVAWMEAHPEVAVSGHGSLQLDSEDQMPADPGTGEASVVTKSALFVSNRFITPSVMLHRDLRRRFEPGKRHMEDYLLWLELATEGKKVARLPQALAYTFKAPFGEAGLSAELWEMEKGELAAFSSLRRKGLLSPLMWLLLLGYSIAKFARRLLIKVFS